MLWIVVFDTTVSRVVAIKGTLRVAHADPDDDTVIECAVAGGATHVVTGDKRHLLPLEAFESVTIVSQADCPEQFRQA